jgi:hypothetical protein
VKDAPSTKEAKRRVAQSNLARGVRVIRGDTVTVILGKRGARTRVICKTTKNP